MNLQDFMLSEINQTKKDKYCMVSLICGIYWEKKKKDRKKTKNELMETESRMVVATGGGGGNG